MSIYEAIFERRSIRKFLMEPVSEDILNKIRRFMEVLSPLDASQKVEFEICEQINKKEKVKGLWKVEAPYYLAVYCEETPEAYRNAGYLAEQIVLYMTTKQLGTCYLGTTKAGEAEKNGLKRFLVIAFGRSDGPLYREAEDAHRMTLSAICTYKDEPGENLKKILKAARMAPSSLNTQPWRFIVYADRIYVFAKKDMLHKSKMMAAMRDFNMGIMLSHIMLTAEELWLDMETLTEEQYAKKAYKNGDYICTINFRN